MITVRFPNGQAVQYNTANHLRYSENAWELYTKDRDRGGTWVASIQLSAGAIVESTPAGRVRNPLTDAVNEKTAAELAAVKKELRAIKRKVGK